MITTIIPTYRRPHLLKKTIQTVLHQTYPHFQLWVCDNASQDETAAVVAEFMKKDSRVKYFCHEKNVGMLANYHFGLSLVDTEFFSFLSDDDAFLPNFYETALEEFRKYPDAGFVAGSTVIMTSKGNIARIPLAYWPREGKYDPPEGAIEMIGKYPVPTSVLFRRKVLDHVSIDTENTFYWDCDYLLQIASIFPIVISKKPCAVFRSHEDSFSNQISPNAYENGFNRLMRNVEDNKSLTPEKLEVIISLLLCDLNKSHQHFFLLSLLEKRFNDAFQITKKMQQCPSFKYKALVFIFAVKLCSLFPICRHGIKMLKFLKRTIRNIKFQENKKYSSYL